MPNADYQPEYSELEKDYQVLTELHRSNDSVTYLARHLGLNRDVTITIMRGVGGDNSALGKFAEDAQLLTKTRDSHIIPVIEGRWLDTNTFAIVHARVRGSTLEQLAGAFGPMPLPRVATHNTSLLSTSSAEISSLGKPSFLPMAVARPSLIVARPPPVPTHTVPLAVSAIARTSLAGRPSRAVIRFQ